MISFLAKSANDFCECITADYVEILAVTYFLSELPQ